MTSGTQPAAAASSSKPSTSSSPTTDFDAELSALVAQFKNREIGKHPYYPFGVPVSGSFYNSLKNSRYFEFERTKRAFDETCWHFDGLDITGYRILVEPRKDTPVAPPAPAAEPAAASSSPSTEFDAELRALIEHSQHLDSFNTEGGSMKMAVSFKLWNLLADTMTKGDTYKIVQRAFDQTRWLFLGRTGDGGWNILLEPREPFWQSLDKNYDAELSAIVAHAQHIDSYSIMNGTMKMPVSYPFWNRLRENVDLVTRTKRAFDKTRWCYSFRGYVSGYNETLQQYVGYNIVLAPQKATPEDVAVVQVPVPVPNTTAPVQPALVKGLSVESVCSHMAAASTRCANREANEVSNRWEILSEMAAKNVHNHIEYMCSFVNVRTDNVLSKGFPINFSVCGREYEMYISNTGFKNALNARLATRGWHVDTDVDKQKFLISPLEQEPAQASAAPRARIRDPVVDTGVCDLLAACKSAGTVQNTIETQVGSEFYYMLSSGDVREHVNNILAPLRWHVTIAKVRSDVVQNVLRREHREYAHVTLERLPTARAAQQTDERVDEQLADAAAKVYKCLSQIQYYIKPAMYLCDPFVARYLVPIIGIGIEWHRLDSLNRELSKECWRAVGRSFCKPEFAAMQWRVVGVEGTDPDLMRIRIEQVNLIL
jgi:hypothetical protein